MLALMAQDPRVDTINRLLAMSGLSLRWLSRQVGAEPATVSNILNGNTRVPRDPSLIDRMMDALDAARPDLNKVKLSHRGMVVIPVYPGLSAGEPAYTIADVSEELIPEPSDGIERYGRIVAGDSMTPVFQPGDVAIMKPTGSGVGFVVHAYRDGEDVLKCARDVNGRCSLYSFNSDYLPLDGEGWKVKAVCVGIIRYMGRGRKQFIDAPNGFTWADREGI